MVSKILNKIQTIEVILALIIVLVIIVPKILGISVAVVQSGSMEPKISVGDLVYYKEGDIDSIEQNDIIVFNREDTLVVHRVVEVGTGYYVTKGDANEVVDSKYVYEDDVEGELLVSIPYLGKITNALQGNKLVYILAAIIVLNVIMSLIIRQQEKKEQHLEKNQEENQKEE